MELEITKMQLSDFEQIENKLQEEFDDFWTPATLKHELENKNRFKLLLYSSERKSGNCGICRSNKNYR